jgi:hypothetical protein
VESKASAQLHPARVQPADATLRPGRNGGGEKARLGEADDQSPAVSDVEHPSAASPYQGRLWVIRFGHPILVHALQNSLRCSTPDQPKTRGRSSIRVRKREWQLSHFRFFAMMIPLDGVWSKKRCIPTRVMGGRTRRCGIGGRELVNWIFALPIALVIVLVLVHALAGAEVAWFLDELVIAGGKTFLA